MNYFTEYDPATGAITRVVMQQGAFTPQAGMSFINGNFDDLSYRIVDGQAVEIEPEVLEVNHEAIFRNDRGEKLFLSDWTQGADSPLSTTKKAEWAAYRQKLRDLPATVDDYSNVTWPEPPM